MNGKPEGRGQDLSKKLSFAFLIECARKKKINEWNNLYQEYLESEWKRIYPKREWDPKNILDLVCHPRFKKPNFLVEDFRVAVVQSVLSEEAHHEGVCFTRAYDKRVEDIKRAYIDRVTFRETHLEGAYFKRAHLERVDFKKAHLEGANFTRACLKGTHFSEAHLEGAHFSEAHLEGAYFQKAHLKGAYFGEAHLEGAYFRGAHIGGADFRWAHIEGAHFIYAVVDGENLFTKNYIDEKTDFTGTALSAIRIDPVLRTKLERNVREIQWKDWYMKPKFYPFLGKSPDLLWGLSCRAKHLLKDPPASSPKKRFDPKDYPSVENSTLYLTLKKILSWPLKPSVTTKNASNQDPEETKDEKNKWETKYSWIDTVINGFVRLFWWLTDYGSSTKRVIGVFFAWNILWAFIYQFLLPLQSSPILAGTNTTVLHTPNIITAVMQTNLMVFSITDVATRNLDYPALIFVTVQIVIGYFILAALITRLGIMFQNLSP